MCRSTNRQVDPEVWFRVVHLARDGQCGAPVAPYREQLVEIALGPKGAFENGNIGTLRRWVSANGVISALSQGRDIPKPAKKLITPRVVELLRKAIEWRRQLDVGKVRNQAEIARREGITRARVTQVMGLLRLPPETQEHIMYLPESVGRTAVTERALRSTARIEALESQTQTVHRKVPA